MLHQYSSHLQWSSLNKTQTVEIFMNQELLHALAQGNAPANQYITMLCVVWSHLKGLEYKL